MTIRRIGLFVLVLLTLAYPILIYFSLQRFDPRWLLAVLAALLGLRGVWAGWGVMGWGPALVALGLMAWGRQLSVMLYPVLINGFFLLWFAVSLIRPPSIIERLARLSDPDLPPEGVRYTRRVTWVWSGFFLLNGSVAAITVALGNLELWTFYNGLLAYLLMGLLMAVEYWVRRRMKRVNGHA
ncbi:MAG: hypothetical protein ACPW60_01380 [Methylohalobius sp. ZOD2]